jgi:hypothetical protein
MSVTILGGHGDTRLGYVTDETSHAEGCISMHRARLRVADQSVTFHAEVR